MTGRTIKVYLADGVPDGLRTAEIMNWTGKMLVFPQSQLVDFLKRPEAKRTGVYILVGGDPNNSTKEQVYIGESDDVHDRLKQHASDQSKDFWSRTVVIISKDENLSKAHARYLESRLIALTKQAKRATSANGNNGSPVSLSESDIADMEFFLTQIQILLPALGFPFAQPLPTFTQPSPATSTAAPTSSSLLLETTVGKLAATAVEANGTFVVRAGSYAQDTTRPGIGNTYREKRDALHRSGIIVDSDQPGYWKFAEDTPFDSLSAAAAVIQGYNVNGRTAWRISGTQQTYKDWQTAQIAAAGISSPNSTSNGSPATLLLPST